MDQVRLLQQIDVWRRDLIDLTRRNSLLNLSNRATSVVLSEPAPEEILSRLLTMRKWTIDVPPEDADEIDTDVEALDLTLPLSPGHLRAERPGGRSVRAALRTLRRRADQEFLDRGLRILYVAFGELSWRDESGEWLSPVLLVPVELEHLRGEPFRLSFLDDEDVVVNPALIERLREGLDQTVLDSLRFDEDRPLQAFDNFRKLASSRAGWVFRSAAQMAVFSFVKEVMYRDLMANEEAVARSPLVRALAFGAESGEHLGFERIPEDQLDESVLPSTLHSILDADSTQRQAILAAKAGKSFVIDGPPGTGKSQTIANIIAELIADRKSVLFVSEKAAALEVVQKRLEAAGLGSFLLPLHSQKVTRKAFASMLLKAALERPIAGRRLTSSELQRLEDCRKSLNAYAAAINEVRQPLGKSLFEVIGEHAKLADFPLAPMPVDSIGTTTSVASVEALIDLFREASHIWRSIESPDDVIWSGLRDPLATERARPQLLMTLDSMSRAMMIIRELSVEIASDNGLMTPRSVTDAKSIVELARLVEEHPNIPLDWVTTNEYETIVAQVQDLCEEIDKANGSKDLLDTADIDWARTEAAIGHRGDNLLEEARSSGCIAFGLGLTLAELERDLHTLAEIDQNLSAAEESGRYLETQLSGSNFSPSVGRLRTLSQAAETAAAAHRPEAIWFTATGVKAAQDLIERIQPLIEDYRARCARLEELFDPDIVDAPVSEMFASGSNEPELGVLGVGRANRRLVKQYAKGHKITKEVRSQLYRVRDLQSLSHNIDELGRQGNVLGAYYFQGVATDLSALVEAVEAAKKCVQLLQSADPALLADALGRASLKASEVATASTVVKDTLERVSLVSDRVGLRLTDRTSVSELQHSVKSALRVWSSLRDELVTFHPASDSVEVESLIGLARERTRLSEAETHLSDSYSHFSDLVGRAFEGLSSDTKAISASVAWATDFRRHCRGPISHPLARRLLLDGFAQPSDLEEQLRLYFEGVHELVNNFAPSQEKAIAERLSGDFEDAVECIESLGVNTDQIEEQLRLGQIIHRIRDAGGEPIIEFAMKNRISGSLLVGVASKAILGAWIENVFEDDKKRLSPMDRKSRDSLVERFVEVDRRLSLDAAARVAEMAGNARPTTSIGAMGTIRHEAEKKSRHMRIPDLISKARSVVKEIAPCFMMSPLSVSSLLPSDLAFDAVIFDEASQILTSNAVNCVYRGKQLIIAGDDKQMPPASIFSYEGGSDDESDEYSEEDLDDFESLLNQANAGGFENLGLRWHYRSRHESLITYSNQCFYEGRLVTYPSAEEESEMLGVSFVHVPDGVYLRGGRKTNPVEARKVVERVIYHADHHPNLTLGVVAFSVAQADEIENALEVALKSRTDLYDYFTADRLNGFFVKNLESVQGDERDIIIFSVGYGPDEHGKITMHFGPVNKPKGWRRLNVAFTRARYRVELVSSMTAGDFSSSTNESVQYLKTYFDYAARGPSALAWNVQPASGDSESPFEDAVIERIQSWGYTVDSQVGQAGFRIDIGVRHPDSPGRYLLGVECDGAAYHRSKVARDRDRLRQEVLEGLGWRLYRIWGPTWYRSPETAVGELRSALETAVNEGGTRIPVQGRGLAKVEHKTDAAGENSVGTIKLSERPEWVGSYFNKPTMSEPLIVRNGAGSVTNEFIDQFILADIDWEGPVDRIVIQRRLAARLGMNRTKKVQALVNQRLSQLQQRGLVLRYPPDCFSLPGQDTYRVRLPDPTDPLSKRDSGSFPEIELRVAITRVLWDVHEMDSEELFNVVVKVLIGLQRLTAQWRDRLESAIDALVQAGSVKSADGRIQIIRKETS